MKWKVNVSKILWNLKVIKQIEEGWIIRSFLIRTEKLVKLYNAVIPQIRTEFEQQ